MLPGKTASKWPIWRHIQEVKSWNRKRKKCSPRPAPIRWKKSQPSFISGDHPPIPWSRKGALRAYASVQPSGSLENLSMNGWINWNCNVKERVMAKPWYIPLRYNQNFCLKINSNLFRHITSLHDIITI